MIASRDRTSDDKILLTAVTIEEDLIHRQQSHEKCDTLLLAQLVQTVE